MKDIDKTKQQFLEETQKMRRALHELRSLDIEHTQVEALIRELEECYRTLFE
jgi:hypothetical protein